MGQDGVNASLLIPLKNPYRSPFDPHWCPKNEGDSGRFGGFSAESTFDNQTNLSKVDSAEKPPNRPKSP
jgi:hypothetical protein